MPQITDPWTIEQRNWIRFSTTVLEFILKEEDSRLSEFEIECIKNIIRMREISIAYKRISEDMPIPNMLSKKGDNND